MKITLHASIGAAHQIEHQEALARGLELLGHEPIRAYGGMPQTEAVACWGWRLGAQYRAAGHDVLVIERGYLGDRFSWSSLAWNGLNGRAHWPPAPKDDGERFERHFGPLQPWRTDTRGYALIVGQVPGDAALQGVDLADWYVEMAGRAELAGFTPVFRPHPIAVRQGRGAGPACVARDTGPLEEALANVAQVITYNSNVGVLAAVAGVPVYADNEGSMAWAVAGREVGELTHQPDRTEWAHTLAWRQFSLAEIADGTALKGLFP